MAQPFFAHPYLSGHHAPVRFEADAPDLIVHGEVPRDLEGVLYRNGPEPLHPPREGDYHWFDGDGMVYAFHFANGRVSMRNRWVRTEKFELEKAAGKRLFGLLGNPMTADPVGPGQALQHRQHQRHPARRQAAGADGRCAGRRARPARARDAGRARLRRDDHDHLQRASQDRPFQRRTGQHRGDDQRPDGRGGAALRRDPRRRIGPQGRDHPDAAHGADAHLPADRELGGVPGHPDRRRSGAVHEGRAGDSLGQRPPDEDRR